MESLADSIDKSSTDRKDSEEEPMTDSQVHALVKKDINAHKEEVNKIV